MELGQTGFFSHTDHEWRTYLTILVEQPDLRKDLWTRGRQDALTHFTIEHITQTYLNLLDTPFERSIHVKG